MIQHRKELRAKVEHRQQLLGRALGKAESAGQPAERIQALSTELNVVKDWLTGGWENMSDVTAGKLARWLEATRTLVAGKPKGIHKPTPPPPADSMADEVEHAENPFEHYDS